MNSLPRNLVLLCVLAIALGTLSTARAERVPPERLDVGEISVRFDASERAQATELAAMAPELLSEVAMLTGDTSGKLEIRVAATARGMRELAPDQAPPPGWAEGVAYPARGLILISVRAPDGGKTDLEDVLVHEITHVSLERATGGREVPRWFHEGFAHIGRAKFDWSRTYTLMRATMAGRIISLARLDEHFPASADHAAIAYAESYDFVEFLAERKGTMGLRALIVRIAAGMRFEDALRAVYADDLTGLEEAWVDELRHRFLWLPLATTGIGLWVLAALLVFLGWRRRRKQNRARLAAWEIEEAAARAAARMRIGQIVEIQE